MNEACIDAAYQYAFAKRERKDPILHGLCPGPWFHCLGPSPFRVECMRSPAATRGSWDQVHHAGKPEGPFHVLAPPLRISLAPCGAVRKTSPRGTRENKRKKGGWIKSVRVAKAIYVIIPGSPKGHSTCFHPPPPLHTQTPEKNMQPSCMFCIAQRRPWERP